MEWIKEVIFEHLPQATEKTHRSVIKREVKVTEALSVYPKSGDSRKVAQNSQPQRQGAAGESANKQVRKRVPLKETHLRGLISGSIVGAFWNSAYTRTGKQ